jgi:hypothetical protein
MTSMWSEYQRLKVSGPISAPPRRIEAMKGPRNGTVPLMLIRPTVAQ